MSDTHDGVMAATADVARSVAGSEDDVSEAVQEIQSRGETGVEAFMAQVEARLTQLEGIVGLVSPILSAASPAFAAVVPEAGPILARLPAIEASVAALVSGLEAHFGGKLTVKPAVMPATPPG